MPTGISTIANVVPYLGELFQTQKRPNALLKLLGGIQGGVRESSAREFPIGAFYTLPAPSQPANLEGANAPNPQYRALTQSTNVVQIFQEAVQITYLAQSDKSVGGVVPIPQGEANRPVQNPRSTEFQVMTTLEKIAQDANYSFLNGTFSDPTDPAATALKTRGILTALVTNVIDHHTDVAANVTAASYKNYVEELIRTIIQQTGFAVDDTYTIMAGVGEFNNIQAAYESKTTPPYDRTVGGLKLRQIYTRFGILESCHGARHARRTSSRS